MCSVEKYNIAHTVHNYLSGEKIVTACATHHLYAANRIRGPIIVMCSIQSKEEWEEVFHTYTQLKVTVMSGTEVWDKIYHKKVEVFDVLNGVHIWDQAEQ